MIHKELGPGHEDREESQVMSQEQAETRRKEASHKRSNSVHISIECKMSPSKIIVPLLCQFPVIPISRFASCPDRANVMHVLV